jgi:hypothetical protein
MARTGPTLPLLLLLLITTPYNIRYARTPFHSLIKPAQTFSKYVSTVTLIAAVVSDL